MPRVERRRRSRSASRKPGDLSEFLGRFDLMMQKVSLKSPLTALASLAMKRSEIAGMEIAANGSIDVGGRKSKVMNEGMAAFDRIGSAAKLNENTLESFRLDSANDEEHSPGMNGETMVAPIAPSDLASSAKNYIEISSDSDEETRPPPKPKINPLVLTD